MSFISDSGWCRISFIEGGIMGVIKDKSIWDVFIPLEFGRVLDNFDSNTDHGCDFSNYIFTHRFCGITIPLVSLSILYNPGLFFIDDFSLVDGFL